MGGPRRRWSERSARGVVVDHPAVRKFLDLGDPGTQPKRHIVEGLEIVAYSSTRVFMKRDAWEMLSREGVLVQWIRPKGEEPWAIALTASELEQVFGEVRESESWEEARCYHFPQVPEAAKSFRVRVVDASSRSAHRAGAPAIRRLPQADPSAVSTEELAVQVLAHLRKFGSLSEAELTGLAGGSRGYRRLRSYLVRHSAPLRLEQTPLGALWRLADDA